MAFEARAAIFPGVSWPSSVVRSIIRIASSSAKTFASRLIERRAREPARSSSATASTEPMRGSLGSSGSSKPRGRTGACAIGMSVSPGGKHAFVADRQVIRANRRKGGVSSLGVQTLGARSRALHQLDDVQARRNGCVDAGREAVPRRVQRAGPHARASPAATGGIHRDRPARDHLRRVDEVRVSSWGQLHQELFADSWDEELGLHRSDFAFRGRADAADDLGTSLIRLGGRPAALEGHLLRNFRKYAELDAVPVDSLWNWLALAQHHGLPTRLLDWTYSPYVALHFATTRREYFDRDGVVWMVDYVRAPEEAPRTLRECLEHEGANVFTTEMLGRVAEGLREFDELGEDFVVFVEPPSFDERIVNQYALFSLMSRPHSSLDDWLAQRPNLARRIAIPADLKWEVRDKLDQANVTERVLFPGLDGLSRWVARYYAPRRP